MTEKLGIMAQQTANAAGVSPTGALSTAVDRMSFAHDIVIMTDDALAIGVGPLDNQVKSESFPKKIEFNSFTNQISDSKLR